MKRKSLVKKILINLLTSPVNILALIYSLFLVIKIRADLHAENINRKLNFHEKGVIIIKQPVEKVIEQPLESVDLSKIDLEEFKKVHFPQF